MPEEKLIKLADVPERVRIYSGITRNRQTAYNWITKGVKQKSGQKLVLKTVTKAGQLFTTETYLKEFLATLDRRD